MTVCPNCKRPYEPELSPRPEDDGRVIQDIYPDSLPYQREQLQTGICSDKCWDEYLKPEQETPAVYDDSGKWVSGGWRTETP
jgi:hypothetical protein